MSPVIQLLARDPPRIEKGELTYPGPDQLRDTPAWAKPIVAAAYKYFGLMP